MQHPQDFPVAPLPSHVGWWLWLPLVLAIGAGVAAMTMKSNTPPPLAAWLTVPFVLLIGAVLAPWLIDRASAIRSGCPCPLASACFAPGFASHLDGIRRA